MNSKSNTEWRQWKEIVAPYEHSSTSRALWQLLNTIVPYVALWYCMFSSISVSLWLLPPLWLLMAGFCLRMFIIHHDCGHGSFFCSKRANIFVGRMSAFLSFAPFSHWKHSHAIHHKTSGILNKRPVIYNMWTLSVDMYHALPRRVQLGYRIVRYPLALFLVGPLWHWLVSLRQTHYKESRFRWSVYSTNIVWVCVLIGLSFHFGVSAVAVTVLPTLYLFGATGLWMFYIQHQYENTYWKKKEEWNYVDAALKGSSYYKLPRILQWFTGSIGFHHVHHLSTRIPNYFLERCHTENAAFWRDVRTITFLEGFRAACLALWDEREQKMISFREYTKRHSDV